jgi:hypothetical protein
MKKTLLVIVLVCATAGAAFAQEGAGGAAAATMADVGLLNLNTYSSLFLNGGGKIDSKYLRVASRDEKLVISTFDRDTTMVDTPLEIALLSTCAGVVDIRPIEADAILPQNNPKLTDTKLGAAAYMDMQAAKFLGNDPAPYAAALKFITDRGNVTEADIQKFMAQGIAAIVDKYYSERGMYDIVPSAVYAEWKRNGVSHGLDGLQIVKDKLAAFYLAPTPQNFAALIGISASYAEREKRGDPFAYEAGNAFSNTLEELNKQLWYAVIDDSRSSTAAIAAAGTAGRDLGIFSLPYAALLNEASGRR